MTRPSPSVWRALVVGWFWLSGLAVGGMAVIVVGLLIADASGLLTLPRGERGVLLIAALLLPATVIVGRAIWVSQTTRWRLWAYPRVDDVGELNRRARKLGLIPRDGSWLERLEPRSQAQTEALRRFDPAAR